MKHEGADEHLLPTSFCLHLILREQRGRAVKVLPRKNSVNATLLQLET